MEHAQEHGKTGKISTQTDPTNPAHYKYGDIECIEAMEASMSTIEYQGYLKGCAFKYLWRFRYKGSPIEDLNKAIWYTQKLATHIKAENVRTKQTNWRYDKSRATDTVC